jgi:CRISPR/Cas system CMR subunit Cmr4 (Cas7 group RAMP superfamily)
LPPTSRVVGLPRNKPINLKDNREKIIRKVINNSSNDTTGVVVVLVVVVLVVVVVAAAAVVVVVVCPPLLRWCHHMNSIRCKSAQTMLSIYDILT